MIFTCLAVILNAELQSIIGHEKMLAIQYHDLTHAEKLIVFLYLFKLRSATLIDMQKDREWVWGRVDSSVTELSGLVLGQYRILKDVILNALCFCNQLQKCWKSLSKELRIYLTWTLLAKVIHTSKSAFKVGPSPLNSLQFMYGTSCSCTTFKGRG